MVTRKLHKFARHLAIAAVLAAPAALLPASHAHAQVVVSVGIAPPALPVYDQPICPGDGFLWTPGYWAYGSAGYFWVPGTWVRPPQAGFLWTPAYWGWEGGHYLFHGGYWGPHVGFYGGINYGFGYGGFGFGGGEWRGGHFFYNTAVAHVGVGFGNVYVRNVTVVNNTHVAFNGGPGGVAYHATAQENQWSHENHMQPTGEQMSHQNFAATDRAQLASVNHGRPGVPAAASPAAFHQNPTNAAAASRPTGREANQDQRIANGERSGQMTSGEAARADRTQAHIDQQVHNDRVANGGTLTGQERQQVNSEQNAASRQIYNDNHNNRTVAPNEVNNREANQQQRTANGIRSGQMTSGEAARTNNNQANVDRQVHNERAANGGALSRQQKAQANREENHDSRQIHNENHNDKRR